MDSLPRSFCSIALWLPNRRENDAAELAGWVKADWRPDQLKETDLGAFFCIPVGAKRCGLTLRIALQAM